MEGLQNINISGSGKINGGKFAEVNISGLGQILGDIEAEKIDISGMGTIHGNTKMQRLVVSGNGTVEGEMEGSELETSGNFKVTGAVKVKEIRNQGRARFDAGLKAEKITSHGFVSVGQDMEAEHFICNGSFTVEGLLNANRIELEINGFGYAREIGGEEIYARSAPLSPWSFLHKFITPFLGRNRELDRLTSEVLEGTIIDIYDTHAKVVRGRDIRIGPGCNIGEVEYSGTLEVHERATVGKQTKLS